VSEFSSSFPAARSIRRACWAGAGGFLGASTEWPDVVPTDVEMGDLDALAAAYPDVGADLRAIAASVAS